MQLTQYTDWNWNDDPSGWLITKEVPGVRVYWDGKRMLTAGGLRISLPVTFKNSLPNIMMEGFLVYVLSRNQELFNLLRFHAVLQMEMCKV